MRPDYNTKIQEALDEGIVRKDGIRALPEQTLTYILSDKKFFHHATLESAKAEKDFLERAVGRKMRLYKIWNVSREIADRDMRLVRADLNKSLEWTPVQEAIDRILVGAGY